MDGWHALRSARSEHQLSQDARILSLLDEMKPARHPLKVTVDDGTPLPTPPNYHTIYPPKRPPPYNVVVRAARQHSPRPSPTWAVSPARLSRGADSPSGRFFALDESNRSISVSNKSIVDCRSTMTPTSPRLRSNGNTTDSATSGSQSSPTDSSCAENCSLTPRNTPRQASFMAAVGRSPLRDAVEVNGNTTPLRRKTERMPRGGPRYQRNGGKPSTPQERRRTTIYGDEILAKCSKPDDCQPDLNHNESLMRRPRPKSYVLATSASMPEGEPAASYSQDEISRDMSSMGSMASMSSMEQSGRTGTMPPPSTHRIHKFMAMFSQKADGRSRLRSKRSRTSLPEGRTPLQETTLRALNVVRQGWLRYQEMAMGKSGKRSHWSEYWAILYEQNLYLCTQAPAATISDRNREKLLSLPPCACVDVRSAVVDIAYDWLGDSRNRHVVRMLTQTKTEHLFELQSESDMLSWITSLQACSEGIVNMQLHNSLSAASLASSSCSSDRNGQNPAATNQLIMHRYKAKSSQLQSPVTSKRSNDHSVQPGTSKENGSGENGEPTTPKSGRKWKKPKANKQGSGSSSSSLPVQSVLGVRLADCALADPEEFVPLVVQMCVSVVEKHGLDTVGIYRIPGNTAAVNSLRDTLSQGIESISVDQMDFSDNRWRDINVVSSFLKMFLRKLPEPLLTDKLYPFFIDANRIASHQNRMHKLRNLLRKLPRHHYCTLRYIIRHLASITKHCDVNKMETRNLALMFGPSIVRPSDDNMATMVTHMSDQCKIIETLVHYHTWMFDEDSTADDPVPDQHPSETGPCAGGDSHCAGVGMPTGVSAATFNDMHNLIRKANEEQAAALMNEGGRTGKIKNMLRRNSRRDKSKGKLKIESTAPAATHPRFSNPPQPQSSVDSAFLGSYQERDIDAEIQSRQTISPLASTVEQSPSLESSVGSLDLLDRLPDSGRLDSSRTDPGTTGDADMRSRRKQDMYSARRMFIAGSIADPSDSRAIDALASHTHHLNIANSPALEVLSEETREKIRKMQRKQNWMEKPKEPRIVDQLKMCSPTKDQTDALSYTSDYSTTSSAPLTMPLAVACIDPPTSSDYASSDPSPCMRTLSSSPRPRPDVLPLAETATTARCQQKIRLRSKTTVRDPSRRHTLSDMDALKEGRLDKLARWFGLRKSSPDVTKDDDDVILSPPLAAPPAIVRTSPNELTPASGDELL